MNKKYIMSNYRRNLSRRFDGQINGVDVNFSDKDVKAGVINYMQIIVKNNDEDHALPFALIPANFDTLRAKFTAATESVPAKVDLINDNCAEMQACGFNISGVAFDGSFDEGANVDYQCCSSDPARTIKQFLNYIKLNPVRLKSLEVVSDDANAFDTSLTLSYVNPFFKNAEQEIDLSVFYSLYQQATDRIRMDFDGQVELSDLSLLRAVIPAGTQMKFTMRFM